ncbi:MAG: DUF481 domain-containing protein [Candidatus Poribacteria bacterium]|jgi:putative salt-induced outer membrane protein YdiY|nr:DUF481 domain-containing protein [Candidatus Poribacteria bacterium]MDP7280962.1 DUF481 domain-containing protein [Candidatus Poribacteria bacterium]
MKFVFRLLFLLCTVVSAEGQINVFNAETMKQIKQRSGFYNTIGLSFSRHNGNVDLLTTRMRVRSDYLTTEYHTFLIGNLQYRKKDANTFDSRGTIHIRGIRKFNARLMIEGFLQKQYSGSILLKDRNLAGGGFRLSPLRSNEKRQIDLYLGIGAMWENELIDDQKLGEFETSILRSTNYATLIWQVDDRFSTATTGYFQMRPNDTNDFRLLVESGFGVRLSKRISLNVELNFRFDNEPPGGIEKHDLEIANSLTLSL